MAWQEQLELVVSEPQNKAAGMRTSLQISESTPPPATRSDRIGWSRGKHSTTHQQKTNGRSSVTNLTALVQAAMVDDISRPNTSNIISKALQKMLKKKGSRHKLNGISIL
ncbi:hypothetical protein V6N13_073445 [Hibiscus sabdariffa]|uniref:Uncharacterized protein n=2 Tax=Hibiscus sabdariffa TaxID=183260 RepID=A0ABR2A199_9ROSI